MLTQIAAILFDLFDTLCHLDELQYREGKRRSARILGLEPNRYFDAWLDLQELSQRGLLRTARDRIREVCRNLGRAPGEEVLEAAARQEEEVLLRCATLHPDVVPTLERLRSFPDLRMALVSNATPSARALLGPLGLQEYFPVAVFSCEVGSVKPEPAIYQEACSRLSVAAPRCLFVGDGNGRELDGALGVGMRAVRIERPSVMAPYRQDPSQKWDFSLSDLRQLSDLLEGRQGSGTSAES
ncbi:MAG TPA: HAD family hydrolase [Candidatus Polarisedimenticolia bacterium]|nr:HAD family hydrolase [Candidatus Polarisedimenticolia bacterium]